MSGIDTLDDPVRSLIARETARPVPAGVIALAAAAKARHPAGAIEAVLYYGSCYREGKIGDGMVDLYLLANEIKRIHPNPWMRFWASRIPPNVYYIETSYRGETLRAKYALVTLEEFERRVSAHVRNPYFWARFAQPTGIVEARDRTRVEGALVRACQTLTAHARSLSGDDAPEELFWTAILKQTYKTELRVEKPERTRQIFEANAQRYAFIRKNSPGVTCNPNPWWLRRLEGRFLSVLRLVKASFTFQGGPDYLAWKIERHSGVNLALTPWQKRHPILAAAPIIWRLWRNRTIS